MKRLIAVVLVLALLAIGLGFYRGWFALSSPSAIEGSNKVNVNLTMDPDKIQEDAQTVKNKTTELVGQGTEQAPEPGDRALPGR